MYLMNKINATLAHYAYETHDKVSADLWNALSEAVRLLDEANELLMAVERKFPGESRHQTALRYIREAESRASQPSAPMEARRQEGFVALSDEIERQLNYVPTGHEVGDFLRGLNDDAEAAKDIENERRLESLDQQPK